MSASNHPAAGEPCPLHPATCASHPVLSLRVRGAAPVMPHWVPVVSRSKCGCGINWFWEFSEAKDYGKNKERFSLPVRKFPAIWHTFNTWTPSVARTQHWRWDRQTVLLIFWFVCAGEYWHNNTSFEQSVLCDSALWKVGAFLLSAFKVPGHGPISVLDM